MEAELDDYDLAIVSPPSFIRARMDEVATARLRKRWLLICQKPPQTWQFDHTERLRRKLAPEKFHRLAGLCDDSGAIRFKPFGIESVVEMTLSYMREKLHLETVTKMLAIKPPAGFLHRRYHRRIVVSPDSNGSEKKTWRLVSLPQSNGS
jgi:hypothetical protein